MYIFPPRKGIQQAVVPGQVGHDAQFDLGIIRRHQCTAGGGDKCLADAAAFRGADGDILQVRIGGGEPARGGNCLVKRGVDAAALGVNLRRQAIGIG